MRSESSITLTNWSSSCFIQVPLQGLQTRRFRTIRIDCSGLPVQPPTCISTGDGMPRSFTIWRPTTCSLLKFLRPHPQTQVPKGGAVSINRNARPPPCPIVTTALRPSYFAGNILTDNLIPAPGHPVSRTACRSDPLRIQVCPQRIVLWDAGVPEPGAKPQTRRWS